MRRSALRLAQPEVATEPVKVPADVNDVESAAAWLQKAAIVLRSTPHYPECRPLLESRQETYNRALAHMREVLGNG